MLGKNPHGWYCLLLLGVAMMSSSFSAEAGSSGPAVAEPASPENTTPAIVVKPIPPLPASTLALIRQLYDPSEAVRAEAAAKLRELFRKDPEMFHTSAAKAHWEAVLRTLSPAMTGPEVLKKLPQFSPHMPETKSPEPAEAASSEMEFHSTMRIGSGSTGIHIWRLDYSWSFQANFFLQSRLITPDTPPELLRKFFDVYVKPPEDYTGVWTTWYVNGQKSTEMSYKDGKFDGVCTSYHDNGIKSCEQHYENGTCNGLDTGWYADGTKMYEGRYVNDLRDGVWLHWRENKTLWIRSPYREGKRNGREEYWHPNGKPDTAVDYINDIRDGIDQCWNEDGEQLWLRKFVNGTMVESR